MWKRTDIHDVEVIDKRYTSKNSSGQVIFDPKRPIKNNTKAFTISCFAKRSAVTANSWEQVGFALKRGAWYNCGFCGADYMYLDDTSASASFIPSVSSVINGKYNDIYFLAFSREEDGFTNHLFLNGKLIDTDTIHSSLIDIFDKITLFSTDSGGITGWIDKVVIHKDICLYKEDFTVLPMDQYPEYKYTEDDSGLKLY